MSLSKEADNSISGNAMISKQWAINLQVPTVEKQWAINLQIPTVSRKCATGGAGSSINRGASALYQSVRSRLLIRTLNYLEPVLNTVPSNTNQDTHLLRVSLDIVYYISTHTVYTQYT